jgi:hypothetical protein
MIANVVPLAISVGSHETRLFIFVPEHLAARLMEGPPHKAATTPNQTMNLLVFI